MTKPKKRKLTTIVSRHAPYSKGRPQEAGGGPPRPGPTPSRKDGIRKYSNQPQAVNAKGRKMAKGRAVGSKREVRDGVQVARGRLPFSMAAGVLCVGEGDFSFALSLCQHHGIYKLIATSYDDEETCYRKYPQAKGNVEKILNSNDEPGPQKEGPKGDTSEGVGNADLKAQKRGGTATDGAYVLFSVDARHLAKGGAIPSSSTSEQTQTKTPISGSKLLRNPPFNQNPPHHTHDHQSPPAKPFPQLHSRSTGPYLQKPPTDNKPTHTGGPWETIIFNYPHVGGLSTDVNRQVRSNQALLVEFFNAAIPLLSKAEPGNAETSQHEDFSDNDLKNSEIDSDADGPAGKTKRNDKRRNGRILVSIFDGEPYTLWNIRDLARHCGLKVLTSTRFPWEQFPGYRHARTVGNIMKRGKGGMKKRETGAEEEDIEDREVKDGEDEEEVRGGWKGEEREGRWYVFGLKDEVYDDSDGFGDGVRKRRRKKEKRMSGGEDDSDED